MIAKSMHKLIKSQDGFTLTELLATVVVVTLATTMVAAGIPSAIESYGKMVDSSNAQSLLSTTTTILRDELAMSTEVEMVDDAISYANDETGRMNTISIKASGEGIDHPGEIMISFDGAEATPLAPLGASSGKDTGELYVTCTGIELDESNTVVTFSDLEVNKAKYPQPLASADTYSIRLISNQELKD